MRGSVPRLAKSMSIDLRLVLEYSTTGLLHFLSNDSNGSVQWEKLQGPVRV